jgi:hypothetical protein
MPGISLADQHDRAGQVDADTRLLVFAPDRSSSETAHEVLSEIGDEAMAQAGIRYVADISAMPGLVTKLFALPKMRDYNYRVLLGREPGDTAALPRRADQVTLIRAEAGQVSAVSYAADAAALQAQLTPYLAP